MTGKIIEEKDEKWLVATSLFDFTQTTEIKLKDLLAYLLVKWPPA